MSRSASFRAGLIVLAILSAGDLFLPLLTDGEHPPMAVALAASVLGLVSLILIVTAWRGGTRAVPALIVLRSLSALAAVPAFTAPGVPAAALVMAASGIALTAIAIVLVIVGARRPALVDSR